MDFRVYNAKKAALQQVIGESLALLEELKMSSTHRALLEAFERLEAERFNLVVIGEFSRGKSTFINAMLGRSILPSSKEATTNIISKIVYGNEPQYGLFYKDGKKQLISEEEFSLIKAQTEEKPEKFAMLKNLFDKLKKWDNHIDFSNIDYAEIAYPLSFCENNVDVVDTPGTNDLNVGRIEITYKYLRQAEAAILVLTATQPLTRTEKDFLVEQVVGNNIKDIFIVINYKDEVLGAEDRVIKHVVDNLRDVQDFSKRIFIVSSKQALLFRRKENGEILKTKALLSCPETLEETGILEFEAALGKYLSEDKGDAKLQKYAGYCCKALREAEKNIQLQNKRLGHSLDELKEKLFNERPKYVKTKRLSMDIIRALEARLQSRQLELEQLADLTTNKIKLAGVSAIDSCEDITRLDGQDLKYLVERAVTPIQKGFLLEINELQDKIFSEEVSQAIIDLKKIWQNMDFDMDTVPISSSLPVVSGINNVPQSKNDNDRAGIAIGSYIVAQLLFGGAYGLLAAATSLLLTDGEGSNHNNKSKIKEQIRNQLNSNLKNFSKDIAQQYARTVNKVCLELRHNVGERIGEMEEQLRMLIEQKEQKLQTVDDLLAVLQHQRNTVVSLSIRLREVLK